MKKELLTLRNNIYVLCAMFSISLLDGLFLIGFSDGFYVVVGLVMLICLVWSFIIIRKLTK